MGGRGKKAPSDRRSFSYGETTSYLKATLKWAAAQSEGNTMTRPVHECEITACSGCGQEFSKAAGARERLCYGCWCKSHPCQVNGRYRHG